MDLVLDANVLFSAFISKEGVTRKLLLDNRLSLYVPEFLLEESSKYLGVLSEKTALSILDVRQLLDELYREANISVFASPELEEFRKKAKQICPDPNDVEYFALALKLACPIWSNDKLLKSQAEVRVLSTRDLLYTLKLI
jgi:predicted nucleic acid-binding protein